MALQENKQEIHDYFKEQAALRALEEAKSDPEIRAILVRRWIKRMGKMGCQINFMIIIYSGRSRDYANGP